MRAILHRKASHWTRAFGLTRPAIKFARLHARALTGERHLLTARDFAILHRKGLLHRYYGYTGPPYFFIPFHFGRKIRTPACVLKALARLALPSNLHSCTLERGYWRCLRTARNCATCFSRCVSPLQVLIKTVLA